MIKSNLSQVFRPASFVLAKIFTRMTNTTPCSIILAGFILSCKSKREDPCWLHPLCWLYYPPCVKGEDLSSSSCIQAGAAFLQECSYPGWQNPCWLHPLCWFYYHCVKGEDLSSSSCFAFSVSRSNC